MTTANLGQYDLKTLLSPNQQELVKMAEQSIELDNEMLVLLARMTPEGRARFAPLVQQSIDRTAELINKMK